MTPHAVMQVPVIPGFIVNLDRMAGELTAVRINDLSDYQRMYGCRSEVRAANPGELENLCLAERLHADYVARAEQVVRGERAR